MKERANRLYELRKSRNLTQTAVAYRLNLSLSRISAYENGENIPCDVLRVFANFYSVSIDYILRFSDRTVGAPALIFTFLNKSCWICTEIFRLMVKPSSTVW